MLTFVPVSAAICFEAPSLDLVPDEHAPLFLGQLAERPFELLQQHLLHVCALGAGVARRHEIFHPQDLAVLGHDVRVTETLRLLPAKPIDDAIARHAEQPAGDVIDRHQAPVGFHELGEDVLQDVLDVLRARHATADEAAQPRLLPRHDVGDPLVWVWCHPATAPTFRIAY